MPVLPLDTPRLRLRVLQPSDLDALVDYRNDPDTARFQFWDVPYTRERAEDEFAGQAGLDDITPSGWTQIAAELRDPALTTCPVLVGDLAVGLEHGGAVATIGYTLAPAWRRRGLAREAVGALIDALFDHTAAHRIVASLDPLNSASERLLIDLGFQREGIARQAYHLRGEWVDDLIYSLVRSDRFGAGTS
jgi:RimJ/RimL family protein N-acetyltransferase